MIRKYTYKFRLDPTDNQIEMFNKYFGCIRWVYNYFLNQRIEEYKNNKKSLTYNKQSELLTKIKKQEETIWLKEINSQSLQYSLKCLDTGFKNFFKKLSGFPKFKAKHFNKNCFTVPENFIILDELLYLPKFDTGIKIIQERQIKGTIKKCSISKTPTGKFYVSILVEQNYEPVAKTNKTVGIDLGLKDFLVLSDGLKTKNHQYLKHYQKLLKHLQQSLSRKIKGSNNYEKNRLELAKVYEKITNLRTDLIHKTTKQLIDKYDIICLEDLNIKGMLKNHKLAKAISDACWGQFVATLTYKAVWNGKEIIKINRWFPSSKTCSCCGYVNHDLKLKDRSWICPICGCCHDRDHNAAKNILTEGLNIISVGTTDQGCGEQIRLSSLSIVCEALKERETGFLETAMS